jgi:hypothetical protein
VLAILPVSEHVDEAGDGGGGISNRSAVSLLLVPSNSSELATAAVAVGDGDPEPPEPLPTGKQEVLERGGTDTALNKDAMEEVSDDFELLAVPLDDGSGEGAEPEDELVLDVICGLGGSSLKRHVSLRFHAELSS